MVMQKPSKSMDIDLIVMVFTTYGHVIHINLHAKNEENPPCSFRDNPMAISANQNLPYKLMH